jgi:hypothetical protein
VVRSFSFSFLLTYARTNSQTRRRSRQLLLSSAREHFLAPFLPPFDITFSSSTTAPYKASSQHTCTHSYDLRHPLPFRQHACPNYSLSVPLYPDVHGLPLQSLTSQFSPPSSTLSVSSSSCRLAERLDDVGDLSHSFIEKRLRVGRLPCSSSRIASSPLLRCPQGEDCSSFPGANKGAERVDGIWKGRHLGSSSPLSSCIFLVPASRHQSYFSECFHPFYSSTATPSSHSHRFNPSQWCVVSLAACSSSAAYLFLRRPPS